MPDAAPHGGVTENSKHLEPVTCHISGTSEISCGARSSGGGDLPAAAAAIQGRAHSPGAADARGRAIARESVFDPAADIQPIRGRKGSPGTAPNAAASRRRFLDHLRGSSCGAYATAVRTAVMKRPGDSKGGDTPQPPMSAEGSQPQRRSGTPASSTDVHGTDEAPLTRDALLRRLTLSRR